METVIRAKVSKLIEKCINLEKDVFEEDGDIKEEQETIIKKYQEILTEFDKEISIEQLGIVVDKEKDTIKNLYVIYYVLDEWIFKKLNADICDNAGWKAEARIRLYMMYLKTFREVLFLLASGFSDCALARTRTLYETGVYINIINKNSDLLAERFCKYSNVQTLKLSKTLPIEGRIKEIDKFINQYNFEDGYKKENGWARLLFPKIKDKNRVQFHDLVKLTLYKDLESLYKMACNYVHGSLFSSFQSLDSAKEQRGKNFWNTSPSNEGVEEMIFFLKIYTNLFVTEFADTFSEKSIFELMLLLFLNGKEVIYE